MIQVEKAHYITKNGSFVYYPKKEADWDLKKKKSVPVNFAQGWQKA